MGGRGGEEGGEEEGCGGHTSAVIVSHLWVSLVV